MEMDLIIPLCHPVEGSWINDRFFFQSVSAYKFIKSKDVVNDDFHLVSLKNQTVNSFCKQKKINLEICSGNGSWIFQKSLENKDISWIAIEKKFYRAKKIWKKAIKCSNLVVACCDAFLFCSSRINLHSIDNCFVNFPDPWSKKRHSKHRLFSKEMVLKLNLILKKGAFLFLVTDSIEMANESKEMILSYNFVETEFTQKEQEEYGKSFFHQLFLSQGKTINFLKFISC